MLAELGTHGQSYLPVNRAGLCDEFLALVRPSRRVWTRLREPGGNSSPGSHSSTKSGDLWGWFIQ
jgi:hypothetical protein